MTLRLTRRELSFVSLMHMTASARLFCREHGEPAIDDATRARLKRARTWALVPCLGQLHVVVVSKRGRVGLVHHGREEVGRWLDFTELGGDGGAARPGCLKWLRVLAGDFDPAGLPPRFNPNTEALPPGLARLVNQARVLRVNRKLNREARGEKPPA